MVQAEEVLFWAAVVELPPAPVEAAVVVVAVE